MVIIEEMAHARHPTHQVQNRISNFKLQGRVEEAMAIIEKMAHDNGTRMPLDPIQAGSSDEEKTAVTAEEAEQGVSVPVYYVFASYPGRFK